MSSVHALLNSYSNLTKTRPCLTETGKWQNWDDWSWLCLLLAVWSRTCFLTLLSLRMEAREWRSWCLPPAESLTLSRGSSYATWSSKLGCLHASWTSLHFFHVSEFGKHPMIYYASIQCVYEWGSCLSMSIRGSGVCVCVFIYLTTYKLMLMKLIGSWQPPAS